MKLAVVIPMKPLARAKARLRPRLGDAARQELAAGMLKHVLAAVAASRVAEA
ncbi:MAG TPA: 2-phospho-L-lactate guanylyltransferase, partial [Anaerolineae bacterium]|nr:2-phospho-L-lactate guanylyltransferase [Anaerolineae bacterium]